MASSANYSGVGGWGAPSTKADLPRYFDPQRPQVGDPGAIYDPLDFYGAHPAGGTRLGQAQRDNPLVASEMGDSGYEWDAAESRYVPIYNSAKTKNDLLSKSMAALFGGGEASSTAPTAPTVSYGGPELTAAQDAAFARAKDRAGALARGAATSVHENAAARNTLGSGFEGEDVAKAAIAPSMDVLGNLNARQLAEAYNAATHGADQAYAGAITQRGQDLQSRSASMAALRSVLNGFF